MDVNAPPPPDAEIPGILTRLIAQSRHANEDRRRAAFEQIYELAFKVGPKAAPAIPVLIDALGDEDKKIVEAAHWALRYCQPESIEAVASCLGDARANVRERAADCLAQMGSVAAVAAPALRALLRDPVENVRLRAVFALGLIRDTDPETLSAFLALAEHGTTPGKKAAFHALGNLGKAQDPPDLTPYRSLIESAVGDPDEDVRWSALYAYEALRVQPDERVTFLVGQLAVEQAEQVQQACLSELCELARVVDLAKHVDLFLPFLQRTGLGTSYAFEIVQTFKPPAPEVIAALTSALESDEHVVRAARALWQATRDSASIMPALERAFDENGESICDLVCEIGAAAAPLVPQLVAALASDYWDLQWAAADALGAVASEAPEVVPSLLKALEHPSPIVRSASARALARCGEPAVPALTRLLESADPRNALAAMALGKMEKCPSTALPALHKGMHTGDQPLSGCCAIAIAAHTGDPASVPHLISAILSADRPSPREAAINALRDLGPAAAQATQALETLLVDEDDEVAFAAHEALGAIRGLVH